ncbi:MAG: hypothetical protein ACKVRO_08065 [Micropepsaceae bacterium]
MNTVIACAIALALSACATQVQYQRAGEEFSTTVGALGKASEPLTLGIRSTFRRAVVQSGGDVTISLDTQGVPIVNAGKSARKTNGAFALCRAYYPYTELALTISSLQVASARVKEVAGSTPKEFAPLATAVFADYDIKSAILKEPNEDSAAQHKKLVKAAVQRCESDLAKADDADRELALAYSGEPELGAASIVAGLQGLWEVFSPSVLALLEAYDNYRRGDALEEFFGHKDNVDLLRDELTRYAKVYDNFATYARRSAAKKFKDTYAKRSPSETPPADLIEELVAAGTAYDEAAALDQTQEIAAIKESIEQLECIANDGLDCKDFGYILQAMAQSLMSSLNTIAEFEKLADDPETRKKMKEAFGSFSSAKKKPAPNP